MSDQAGTPGESHHGQRAQEDCCCVRYWNCASAPGGQHCKFPPAEETEAEERQQIPAIVARRLAGPSEFICYGIGREALSLGIDYGVICLPGINRESGEAPPPAEEPGRGETRISPVSVAPRGRIGHGASFENHKYEYEYVYYIIIFYIILSICIYYAYACRIVHTDHHISASAAVRADRLSW